MPDPTPLSHVTHHAIPFHTRTTAPQRSQAVQNTASSHNPKPAIQSYPIISQFICCFTNMSAMLVTSLPSSDFGNDSFVSQPSKPSFIAKQSCAPMNTIPIPSGPRASIPRKPMRPLTAYHVSNGFLCLDSIVV